MAELVLLDAKHYVAGLDFSGSYSDHALALESDAPEFTAFGDTTRVYKGGLVGAGAEHEGYWDNPIDLDLFTNIGAAARNATLAAVGADGDIAFFYETIGTSYSPGANIGDAYMFSASDQVTGLVTRGLVMATGAKTSTADGTARQLGAVSATQSIRASLHVLAVSGTDPTLDVIVESDDEEAFGGTPETQITFAEATAVGGELLTTAGAITDDWWRVGWTIGGTDNPSFTFVVAVGIA